MKNFVCGACGQMLYFHNVQCMRCGHRLGFVPDSLTLAALEPAGEGRWRVLSDQVRGEHRCCANYEQYAACNWTVPAEDPNPLCVACRLNRTIPDLSVVRNVELWRRLQTQKNRLIYGLMRLGLEVPSKRRAPRQGLAFDFLADPNPRFREGGGVTIGHADGVITLDIAEADDAVRERQRQNMAEPYRTILGHFRHESGHYYWERLVASSRWLEAFRACFGDERSDYAAALARHYATGPTPGWPKRFVSAYASSHPWEDWAETWAHYLHMVDTLETAWQFGLRLNPEGDERGELALGATFDPFAASDVQELVAHWLPLTVALNSLNYSMGQGDAYPFVLTGPVINKLKLIHAIIHDLPWSRVSDDAAR